MEGYWRAHYEEACKSDSQLKGKVVANEEKTSSQEQSNILFHCWKSREVVNHENNFEIKRKEWKKILLFKKDNHESSLKKKTLQGNHVRRKIEKRMDKIRKKCSHA